MLRRNRAQVNEDDRQQRGKAAKKASLQCHRCQSGVREAKVNSVMKIMMHLRFQTVLLLPEAFFNATQN